MIDIIHSAGEILEKVKAQGTTFGRVACLAQCAGAQVESLRTNQTSIDDFRRHVIKCASSDDCHIITSYPRTPFKQVVFRFLLVLICPSFICG